MKKKRPYGIFAALWVIIIVFMVRHHWGYNIDLVQYQNENVKISSVLKQETKKGRDSQYKLTTSIGDIVLDETTYNELVSSLGKPIGKNYEISFINITLKNGGKVKCLQDIENKGVIYKAYREEEIKIGQPYLHYIDSLYCIGSEWRI